MTAYILHRIGQSIYDLCLQAYGTLDYLVKFCNDNGVDDMGNIPQQVNYQYDTTLAKYDNNPNIYSTMYGGGTAYYTNQNGKRYITQAGNYYVPNS